MLGATFDLQQEARRFPRAVPLGSIAGLVAKALVVVGEASRATTALPSDAAHMAQSNLGRVQRGLESVVARAATLLRSGQPAQSPAPPDVMAELRKWALQAFIEANSITAGNDAVAHAQAMFFQDVADQAKVVGTWIVQAPGKLVSTALEPVTGSLKWVLLGLGVSLGAYLWWRSRSRS